MTEYTPAVTGTGARAVVQRFGAFLAGMVMPNLGAFIAFGLITSLFIPDGWVNKIAGTQTEVSAQISSVVGPLVPSMMGTPVSFASALALALSPNRSSASGDGPTKVIPASAHAPANSGFSERNPYPG